MYILVDCNNFYVSCERVFQPYLDKVPTVVLSNNDGCIISRSQEVKDIGIPMGAPAFKIDQIIKKHKIQVFSANFPLYGALSSRVMEIIKEIVPDRVEVYSIDEAFIDMKGFSLDSVIDAAFLMKNKIEKGIGIPVGIGIASNKVLAKVATEVAKKDKTEICLLENDSITELVLGRFPIEEIWGIGRQYTKFLKRWGIHTALKLRECDDKWIQKNLRKVGLKIVHELRGLRRFELEHNPVKKNIGTSRTFSSDTNDISVLENHVSNFIVNCCEKLRAQKSYCNVVYLFLETNRFKDTKQYRRAVYTTLPFATNITMDIIEKAIELLHYVYKKEYYYKRAGVLLSGIINGSHQLDLFDERKNVDTKTKLSHIVDKINRKFGQDVVKYASQGSIKKRFVMKQAKLSNINPNNIYKLPIVKAN